MTFINLLLVTGLSVKAAVRSTLSTFLQSKSKSNYHTCRGLISLSGVLILTACGDGSPSHPSGSDSLSATMSINTTTGVSTANTSDSNIGKIAGLPQIAATRGKPNKAIVINDVVSADNALYSSVPWGQVPANGFFFVNNTFGKGGFVNGIDYVSTLTAQASTFPTNAVMKWNWPDATSGAHFAYAYPEIFYGGGPWGNPYKSVGPWPQKVKDNTRLVANYDIALNGNTNSYNVLLDIYLTESPTSIDGSHTAEISFFPHFKDPSNLTNVTRFSFGLASVFRQNKQILVRPVNEAHVPVTLLVGSINIKEVLDYLVSIQWITGEEYLRGAEFGVEVQVPNYYNSTPHQGSMAINHLSYDWN